MAYFSDATESDLYRIQYCDVCAHNNRCPIWKLHLLYNFEQMVNEHIQKILDTLIPRDGAENRQCRMFFDRADSIREQDLDKEAR